MRAPSTLAPLCLLPVLLLTACSGGDDDPSPESSSSTTAPSASATEPGSAAADPCLLEDSPTVTAFPGACISDGPTAAPSAPAPPNGSAAYKALRLQPEPKGQLKAIGNHEDVNKTSETFTLKVSKGARLGVHAVCEGRTEVSVKTVPDTGAAIGFTCGFEGSPAEIGSADPKLLAADTTYQVTVSVPAPARWYMNFYQLTEGVPAEPAV